MNAALATADPCPAPPAYRAGSYVDEAHDARGEVRAHTGGVLDALSGCDLAALTRHVAEDVERCGMSFRAAGGDRPFPLDPVPRVISRREWELLERGLVQRARALNAFLDDLCGHRHIVAAGRVPGRVLEGAAPAEPGPHAGPRAAVAGFDVVRGADGELCVLEDNLRTPSGAAYAHAAREIVDRRLPMAPPRRRADADPCRLLLSALRGAAPSGVEDPVVVLLSDGPANNAWWEHQRLARTMGIPLVTPPDIEVRGARLHARLSDDTRVTPVDVVYRRTDETSLRDSEGRPTWLGEAMLKPLAGGTLACVNAFGTGVADDKLVHAYVEEMVRFYLGEEPVVRSVATYDPGEPETRAMILERIGDLVVKPRDGSGGAGIVIGPHARAEDRARVAEAVRRRPESWVAQETVALSTHPTVIEGALEPRHVDLRCFAYSSPDGVRILPGGLTRVALDRGALVVNSSMNGGGKDTWVLT